MSAALFDTIAIPAPPADTNCPNCRGRGTVRYLLEHLGGHGLVRLQFCTAFACAYVGPDDYRRTTLWPRQARERAHRAEYAEKTELQR